MKTFRFISASALTVAMAVCLTACSDDHKDPIDVTVNPTQGVTMDQNGVWAGCNNPDDGDLSYGNLVFSHQATVESYEYGGQTYTYTSWYGFCPSSRVDDADYSGGDWVANQWNSIAGLAPGQETYFICFWKSDETGNDHSLQITGKNGSFSPKGFYVTNNTYAYYTMKNGSAFSQPFGADSWQELYVVGLKNGKEVSKVTVKLAQGADILNKWQWVNLSDMGEVDTLYFTMASSDSGAWGINTPAYFCLSDFTYYL